VIDAVSWARAAAWKAGTTKAIVNDLGQDRMVEVLVLSNATGMERCLQLAKGCRGTDTGFAPRPIAQPKHRKVIKSYELCFYCGFSVKKKLVEKWMA
jgi:hypothetical protein